MFTRSLYVGLCPAGQRFSSEIYPSDYRGRHRCWCDWGKYSTFITKLSPGFRITGSIQWITDTSIHFGFSFLFSLLESYLRFACAMRSVKSMDLSITSLFPWSNCRRVVKSADSWLVARNIAVFANNKDDQITENTAFSRLSVCFYLLAFVFLFNSSLFVYSSLDRVLENSNSKLSGGLQRQSATVACSLFSIII